MLKQHKIYDISLPISESLAVWPGDQPVKVTQSSHLARGDRNTVSTLAFGAHTGTHVDAPAHFIFNGSGVDTIDLNVLMGPAFVVETLDVELLTATALESLSIPQYCDRVLFHTRNSRLWEEGYSNFNDEYVAISEDGARWLVSSGFRLVGTDSLSVAPFGNGTPTHHTLLSAGIVVVEGLDLRGIKQGGYQFVC
ncbi:MAG: cyclase family protein, partial [Syntrophaceae bacterium]|nr:cyclase family protein [Syntrophaceae bacterium]